MFGVTGENGFLAPYRVLDLTDEKGAVCGKILGDLGADVIKIERPGGDASCRMGPFYHDEPDPEKSLLWFALNNSKRGITFNIETPQGREILLRLARSSVFVIESFSPGRMDELGIGFNELSSINPVAWPTGVAMATYLWMIQTTDITPVPKLSETPVRCGALHAWEITRNMSVPSCWICRMRNSLNFPALAPSSRLSRLRKNCDCPERKIS